MMAAGRPSMDRDMIYDKIMDLNVDCGFTFEKIAALIGISWRILYMWLDESRQPTEAHKRRVRRVWYYYVKGY